mgnify:CR=1 FL=1
MFHVPQQYTVESVTAGHPDKMCDQISDAILDECLRQDPQSRVAVEVFGSHGLLVIGGEVTTKAIADYEAIARHVYAGIGYPDQLRVIAHVAQQSPDIARGVDTGGAGDQGIMYGYATDETLELMPCGVVLAHALARGLEKLRRENKNFNWLRPDGKTQVTIRNNVVETVVVSCQHDKDVALSEVREAIIKNLVRPIAGSVENIYVNPAGEFIQGGFAADAGLTGRKIMVDTYGGLAPHGGGAFSGKDATKVDRSAAYACRAAAVWAVRNDHAKKCLVSVAYAIGRAEPVMIQAVTEDGNDISKFIAKEFDFRPRAIIERFGLRQPIFQQTATYGHFGKSNLPWE